LRLHEYIPEFSGSLFYGAVRTGSSVSSPGKFCRTGDLLRVRNFNLIFYVNSKMTVAVA
jgi:hypothetical protein